LNQNLDYDYPISHSLLEWHTLFGLLSLAGILVLGILLFRRYRLIAFGIFWFFLTLSVESSIIPISQNVIFEHRTYLPGFGLFLVLTGIVFYFLWDRYRRVGWAILVLIALTNTVLTYERNKVWASEYTLWADCLKKSPNKPRPLYNYGRELAYAGHASEALMYYDKAIKVNPHLLEVYYNRGIAYGKLGNHKQAIGDFDRAIEINPKYAEAYNTRGIAYNNLGNYTLAIGDFDRAIEIKPTFAAAYYNRGIAYDNLGNHNQAIENFKIASKLGNKASQDFLSRHGIDW
jgi:tetratricopeptide (TPR) repeat protein